MAKSKPAIPADPNTLKWQATITDADGKPKYSVYQRHTFRPQFGCYWPQAGAILEHNGGKVRRDSEFSDLLKETRDIPGSLHTVNRPTGVSEFWVISDDLREAISR